MATIRVTGVQMAVSDKLSDNLDRILHHINSNECDFMLFPELALTGHNTDFGDKSVRAAWDTIGAACRRSYTTAIVGTGCKQDGHTYIQSRVYSHEGELLGTYEKLVPTAQDREFYYPGEELRVFESDGFCFGCLIGNDLWVAPGHGPYPDPRLSLQLAKRGVAAVFHSAATGPGARYSSYFESNLFLRAHEAGVYIFTVNAATPESELSVPSGVVSPEGKWATSCPPAGEHTYAYDLTLEE